VLQIWLGDFNNLNQADYTSQEMSIFLFFYPELLITTIAPSVDSCIFATNSGHMFSDSKLSELPAIVAKISNIFANICRVSYTQKVL